MTNSNGTDGAGPSLRERLEAGRDEARELGEQVGEIAAGLQYLALQEVQLAVAEAQEQVRNAAFGSLFLLVGATFAYLTVGFLLLALLFGLATELPLWAAALITASVTLVLTAGLLLLARDRFRKFSLRPRRLVNSLREDLRWARSQMTSNGR